MMDRRELIIGSACLVAAGASYAAKPRHHVSLLGADQLADILPMNFGPWQGQVVADPLALNQEGSLSAKLYNQLVVRGYVHRETSEQILMLFAYGARQSDDLQLHRPEVCYPAFGYMLTRNEPFHISLGANADIPVRRLLATAPDRQESIIYWSRLGEYLPQTGDQQRGARFQTAFRGIIPDGVLSRFSMTSGDTEGAWATMEAFIRALILAIPASRLNILIGTERAKAITSGARSPAATTPGA